MYQGNKAAQNGRHSTCLSKHSSAAAWPCAVLVCAGLWRRTSPLNESATLMEPTKSPIRSWPSLHNGALLCPFCMYVCLCMNACGLMT